MRDLSEAEFHVQKYGGGRLGFDPSVSTFSSWPEEQEESFRVFENRMRGAARSAWNIGLFSGVGFGALIIVVIIAFWGDIDASMGIHGGPGPDKAAPTAPAPTGSVPTPAAAPTPTGAPAVAPAPAPTGTAPAAEPAAQPAANPAPTAPATPK